MFHILPWWVNRIRTSSYNLCSGWFLSWYDGSISQIISILIPSNMMYPGWSSCDQSHDRNRPGILMVITFLSSITSIKHEHIRVYSDTVSELDYSLVIYSRWGQSSAHPIPFVSLLCFLFKNMRYPNACFLISHVMSCQDNMSIHPLPSRLTSSLFLAV